MDKVTLWDRILHKFFHKHLYPVSTFSFQYCRICGEELMFNPPIEDAIVPLDIQVRIKESSDTEKLIELLNNEIIDIRKRFEELLDNPAYGNIDLRKSFLEEYRKQIHPLQEELIKLLVLSNSVLEIKSET